MKLVHHNIGSRIIAVSILFAIASVSEFFKASQGGIWYWVWRWGWNWHWWYIGNLHSCNPPTPSPVS